MASLTVVLTAADKWWQSDKMASARTSAVRYGRIGRAFHLGALGGIAKVRDPDTLRKDIAEHSPHMFYDGGGIGDAWRRIAPLGIAYGLGPGQAVKVTKTGMLLAAPIYKCLEIPASENGLMELVADEDGARAAAPIIRQCLQTKGTGSGALQQGTYDLCVQFALVMATADLPASKSERRRRIRVAFRTLLQEHSTAGATVATHLANVEQQEQAKRASAQKGRRSAETVQQLQEGADPVGRALAVIATWIANGLPEPHLPTPLPKLGKGKAAKDSTRRNVLDFLASKAIPEGIAKLDGAPKSKGQIAAEDKKSKPAVRKSA